jgi:ketose-bisphosphate aldolase
VVIVPLVKLKPLLEDAKKNKYCIGSFNVFNIETLEGVVEAAVNVDSPVICGIYEPHMKYTSIEIFSNLVKDYANKVKIPIILHLDHAEEISSVVNAVKCGFTSIMYDGPQGISYKEKIERTKKVVEIAHSIDLTVESELGRVTRVGVDDSKMDENKTDPELAGEFVEKTGIDILAPAVGSISGMGDQGAFLDLGLLKQIKEKTDCFLSLHGGSGVDDNVTKKLVETGINKASVYTRISNTAVDNMNDLLKKGVPDLYVLMSKARDVFREMVENRLEVFGSKNKGT